MKDTKDFQKRYNRWKNGERYWDIRGVELPKYDTEDKDTKYHPTFSDESIFSGNISDFNPLGIIGGHWNEAGTEYTPSASQLQNYFNYDVTRDYLNRNEDHPVKINLPKYGGGKIGGFVHRMGPLIYQGLVSRGVKNINAAYANLMRQISHESGYGTSGISRQHNYGE